jgi:hypothetical protein
VTETERRVGFYDSFLLPHLASAALRARDLRCFSVSVAAARLPPTRPPAAANADRSSGDMDSILDLPPILPIRATCSARVISFAFFLATPTA